MGSSGPSGPILSSHLLLSLHSQNSTLLGPYPTHKMILDGQCNGGMLIYCGNHCIMLLVLARMHCSLVLADLSQTDLILHLRGFSTDSAMGGCWFTMATIVSCCQYQQECTALWCWQISRRQTLEMQLHVDSLHKFDTFIFPLNPLLCHWWPSWSVHSIF